MSKRDVRVFVADMLQAIEKIERYTRGLSFDHFERNDMVTDAVVRNLEVIGEAARHIPPGLREQYPEIDWTRVIGFRNIVIHAYFAVDLEIAWTIATQRLSQLKTILQRMLRDMATGS